MPPPDLQNYITQSRQQGLTDDQIRHNLVGQGWKQNDIISALTPNIPSSSKNSKIKKIFTLLVPTLWIIALFLPAYIFPPSLYDSKPATYFGYYCLLFGWAGSGLAFLAWISNLPWLISYLLFLSNKPVRAKSIFLAGIAFVFSLSALTINELILSEAGHIGKANVSIGAFVWILSMLVLLIGNIAVARLQKRSTTKF